LRGEDGVELPDWADEVVRLHDAIELTGWSIEQIEATPAVLLDRLLLVHAARERNRVPQGVLLV
jgi:hypothetical protein